MRTLFFFLLISAGFALTGPAYATPASGAALGATAAQSSSLTLVRDGCGPDRHYSHPRGICVWDPPRYREYGPPAVYAPPLYYGAPAVAYGPPPADYYIDPGGFYARTVIHETPRGRYFDLRYD